MHENCNGCNQDYLVETSNAVLHLFIEDYIANHVEAHCPHCGEVETIFTTPAGFVRLQAECKLGITIHLHADESLRQRANIAWGRHEATSVETGDDDSNVLISTYDLTDRHEQDIAGFAASIAAVPVELFWLFIEDDTNHDRPERWV